jgi:hypothetical protein
MLSLSGNRSMQKAHEKWAYSPSRTKLKRMKFIGTPNIDWLAITDGELG